MQLIATHTLCGQGEGPGQFRVRLTALAVDSADRLIVAGDRSIYVFSRESRLECQFELTDAPWSMGMADDLAWVGLQGGAAGYRLDGKKTIEFRDDRLGRVTGIAVGERRVALADATNRAIFVYDMAGNRLREVGADVNTRGFMLPNGVLDLALDPQDQSFVVAHSQKHRVERYRFDGKTLGHWGKFGMQDPADFGGCCNPTNIAVSATGLLAVSEKAPPRVKVYDAANRLLGTSSVDVFEASAKNIALAFDGQQRLYAADPQTCLVTAFALVGEGEEKP